MSKKFIDVSQWQGDINVADIAKENEYTGVIIRSGSGVGINDKKMIDYVSQCKEESVKYGFYHYGYIGYSSTNTAKNEAEYFIELIEPYYYDGMPLAYDLEEDCTTSADDVYEFCDLVSKAYPNSYVMIYTNTNHYNRLNINSNKYAIWFAKPDKNYNNNTGLAIAAKQYHFGENGGDLGDLDLNADYNDIFNIMTTSTTKTSTYYAKRLYTNTNVEYQHIMQYYANRGGVAFTDKNATKQLKENGEVVRMRDILGEEPYAAKYVGKARDGLWIMHEVNTIEYGVIYYAYRVDSE